MQCVRKVAALCLLGAAVISAGLIAWRFWSRRPRPRSTVPYWTAEQILHRRRLIGSLPLKQDEIVDFASSFIEAHDGSMAPDVSSCFLCLRQTVHDETTDEYNHRAVLFRYNLLTRTCVPFLKLDNYKRPRTHFCCQKNYFLVIVQEPRVKLMVYNLSTGTVRRMQLEAFEEFLGPGDHTWMGSFYRWTCTFPDTIRVCLIFPESGTIRVLTYEPKSESQSWEIVSVHTMTFPFTTLDLFWMRHCYLVGEKFLLYSHGEGEDNDGKITCFLYDGTLGAFELNQIEDLELPSWRIPLQTFCHDFLSSYGLGKALAGVPEEPRQAMMIDRTDNSTSIYALDFQPRTLKSLALDALFNSFPAMRDLGAESLKSIGVPPPFVNEMEEQRFFEQNTEAHGIPVVDLRSDNFSV